MLILKTIMSATGPMQVLAFVAVTAFIILLAVAMAVALAADGTRARRAQKMFVELLGLLKRDGREPPESSRRSAGQKRPRP